MQPAFQAEYVGSIPITRSRFSGLPRRSSIRIRRSKTGGSWNGHPLRGVLLAGKAERTSMTPRAKKRLSFYLLIGLTLYASIFGAA